MGQRLPPPKSSSTAALPAPQTGSTWTTATSPSALQSWAPSRPSCCWEWRECSGEWQINAPLCPPTGPAADAADAFMDCPGKLGKQRVYRIIFLFSNLTGSAFNQFDVLRALIKPRGAFSRCASRRGPGEAGEGRLAISVETGPDPPLPPPLPACLPLPSSSSMKMNRDCCTAAGLCRLWVAAVTTLGDRQEALQGLLWVREVLRSPEAPPVTLQSALPVGPCGRALAFLEGEQKPGQGQQPLEEGGQ